IARAQSPDGEEPNKIMLPPPDRFGIPTPEFAQNSSSRKPSRRGSWQPVSQGDGLPAQRAGRTQSAEKNISADADNDRFYSAPEGSSSRDRDDEDGRHAPQVAKSRSKWRAVGTPAGAR